MNQTIALDRMLHEVTDQSYRNLVTRPTGAAVRDRVVHALRDHPRREAVLDFSRIGLVDFSCADEIVAKLVQAMHELPVTRVILTGIREDHADAIDQALGRHGLMVLALEAGSGQPRLLGEVPVDWRAAFEVLRLAAVPRDVSGVAADLDWPTPRALQALDGLVTCRCVLGDADGRYQLGALS